jgi:hypothetical protein
MLRFTVMFLQQMINVQKQALIIQPLRIPLKILKDYVRLSSNLSQPFPKRAERLTSNVCATNHKCTQTSTDPSAI